VEIIALAQQAVSIVAARLSAVGAGVVDAAENGAVGTIYGLLRERLSRTTLGKTVLEQLQQQPQDPERQQVAAAAVAEQAQADPEFAEMLRLWVGTVVDQGNTGQVVRHSPVNVTAARDMRVHRSNIAAGCPSRKSAAWASQIPWEYRLPSPRWSIEIPSPSVPTWILNFEYYDGRWQLDFTVFADRYLRYGETHAYCSFQW